jgi:hypothetical protein
MASLILFTDAPSLNESFEANRETNAVNGIPVLANFSGFHNKICPVYTITEEGLVSAVNKVLSLSEIDRREIGRSARLSFLEDKRKFEERFGNLLVNLERK